MTVQRAITLATIVTRLNYGLVLTGYYFYNLQREMRNVMKSVIKYLSYS